MGIRAACARALDQGALLRGALLRGALLRGALQGKHRLQAVPEKGGLTSTKRAAQGLKNLSYAQKAPHGTGASQGPGGRRVALGAWRKPLIRLTLDPLPVFCAAQTRP